MSIRGRNENTIHILKGETKGDSATCIGSGGRSCVHLLFVHSVHCSVVRSCIIVGRTTIVHASGGGASTYYILLVYWFSALIGGSKEIACVFCASIRGGKKDGS